MAIKKAGKAVWQWIKKSGAKERTANKQGRKRDKVIREGSRGWKKK